MASGDRLIFKVIIVGRENSGKTSLAKSFVMGCFPYPACVGSIGSDFDDVNINVTPTTEVTIRIWDTAGQERYHAVSDYYYRGANVALVCFDSCSEKSFSDVEKWIGEVKLYSKEEEVQIYLVATKIGRIERIISPEQGRAFADNLNIPYKEVCCTHMESLQNLFNVVSLAAYTKYLERKSKQFLQSKQRSPSSIPLSRVGIISCGIICLVGLTFYIEFK